MTRSFLAQSLALVAAMLFVPATVTAQGAGSLVIHGPSGRCLDVAGDPGVDNGLPLQLLDCEWSGFSPTFNPSDQFWVDPGRDVAVFIPNTLSGRCIDVEGDPGLDPGLPLRLWDCESSGFSPSSNPTDQLWDFRSDGLIQNALSGLCVTVAAESGLENGAPLRLGDCDPSTQAWSSTVVAGG